MPAIVLRWMIWGIGEVLLTLVLATIAPVFINSSWAWIGFLLWLGIILLWIGSVLYVINVVGEAWAVRRLIVRHFPQYHDRSWCDFVGLSLTQVRRTVAAWYELHQDRDFQAIGLSPLEFIKGDSV